MRASPAGTSRRRHRKRRRVRSAGATPRGRRACGRSDGSSTRCSRRGRGRRRGSCPPEAASRPAAGCARAGTPPPACRAAPPRGRHGGASCATAPRRERARRAAGSRAPSRLRDLPLDPVGELLRAGRRGRAVRPREPARVVGEPGLACGAKLADEPLQREPAKLGVVAVRRRSRGRAGAQPPSAIRPSARPCPRPARADAGRRGRGAPPAASTNTAEPATSPSASGPGPTS